MSSAPNSLAWCQQILKGLSAAGVTDLVVCPGSRSTPLLLAAINSPLTLHSVIDERSAAFFALGRARADDRAVALLCTSGSAGAHWLPALLEAKYAGHRLVAMTADRPPEMHDTGANQTIAQARLFAAACPPCVNLGVPNDSDLARKGVAARVQQAIAHTPGPVHLNLPFRKPLEPSVANLAQAKGPAESNLPTMQLPEVLASSASIEALAARCNEAKRGLIVAGPATHPKAGSKIVELARKTGFVLLAESTSGARFHPEGAGNRCDAFSHLLATPDEHLRPDLILRFGLEPVGANLNRWLQQLQVPSIQFCDRQTINPNGCSQELIFGDSAEAAYRLTMMVEGKGASSYLGHWRSRDEEAWASVATTLQALPFGEAHAVSSALRSLPANTQLTMGNSLPIRMADAVVPGMQPLRVLHQRGASGIDGLIAGAIGSSGDEFSALLLGDVSCTHDLSSLALAPHARGPVAILVIDNEGGQIFSHLPVAAQPLEPKSWELWSTPPRIDFQSIARGYGVHYQRATSDAEIASAIDQASQRHCTLIHMPVPADSAHAFLPKGSS